MERANFMNDAELAEKGLKQAIKYVALFWNDKEGWHQRIFDNEHYAKQCRGYQHFAGMARITCVAPVEA